VSSTWASSDPSCHGCHHSAYAELGGFRASGDLGEASAAYDHIGRAVRTRTPDIFSTTCARFAHGRITPVAVTSPTRSS
jgi:hypothetical protein